MKKLIQGSIALLLFSISIMVFQISCKKEVVAVPTVTKDPATVFQEGKIIVQNADGSLAVSNYDGTHKANINITLPAGLKANFGAYGVSLSPDHKTIFFTAVTTTTPGKLYLYSCGIDGSNPKQVNDVGGLSLPF